MKLSGIVEGSVSSTGYAGAQAGYYINFGGETLHVMPPDNAVGIDVAGTRVTHDPFLFSYDLVAPGTVLNNEDQITVLLNAVLYGNRSWTVERPNVHDTYTALATIDFYYTLGFTSLDVPVGIDWNSESGVFLTSSSGQVPLPSTLLLFLGGLAAIGATGQRDRFMRSNNRKIGDRPRFTILTINTK